MNIDDSIIIDYLTGRDDYKEHWLFYSIAEGGEYMFEQPSIGIRNKVSQLHNIIINSLKDFVPFNQQLFTMLFPKWRELIEDVNVVLSVGSPKPYDAMVREHAGKPYMIFDLARLIGYRKSPEEMLDIVTGMITHEFTHVCVHCDYPEDSSGYVDRLKHITFDEGFAHILAFNKNIMDYDFSDTVEKYYRESLDKLWSALGEKDKSNQERLLEEANSGRYWSKFASISGKLYLAVHLSLLQEIYKAGPEAMIKNMGL
jgi:hypothetical protein